MGQALWEQSAKIDRPCDVCPKPYIHNARTKQLLTASAGCCTPVLSVQARNPVCYASLKVAACHLVQQVQPEEALLSSMLTKKCQLARRTTVKAADPELILRILKKKKKLTVASASSKTWHDFSVMQDSIKLLPRFSNYSCVYFPRKVTV